jgi:hypothetical protein
MVIGFIDHLHTRLVSTSNYIATAKLRNSQITTALSKPYTACRVFNSCSQATASNSGGPSASRVKILSSQPPVKTPLVVAW